MHKVIHKVVGTFARVVERKRKVETLSPSYRACEAGFGEETEAKRVTGADHTLHRMLALGAPACSVKLGRGAREGAKRADAGQEAPTRLVSFCGGADAADRTLSEHCLASGYAVVAVRSEVREDRTLACVRSWYNGRVRS
jgi:hypothetical protein